jgi:cytidylate kinase
MQTKKPINIAIDGPSGAGKSTVAKLVAQKLGIAYVDTGAMYRAIAYAALNSHVPLNDENEVVKICAAAPIHIAYENDIQVVYVNGENVNAHLRTEEVTKAASLVAKYPAVREKLAQLQRSLAAGTSCIMDGRDIGTKILPQADLKIFLTASVSVRAKRRYLEQQQKSIPTDITQIEADIEARDYQDTHRQNDPLRQAQDAIYLDTSDMTQPEVVAKILSLCQEIPSKYKPLRI